MTEIDKISSKIAVDSTTTNQNIDVSKTRIGEDKAVGTDANQMQGVSMKKTSTKGTIDKMKKNGMSLSKSKQGVFYMNADGEKKGSNFETTIDWIADPSVGDGSVYLALASSSSLAAIALSIAAMAF